MVKKSLSEESEKIELLQTVTAINKGNSGLIYCIIHCDTSYKNQEL